MNKLFGATSASAPQELVRLRALLQEALTEQRLPRSPDERPSSLNVPDAAFLLDSVSAAKIEYARKRRAEKSRASKLESTLSQVLGSQEGERRQIQALYERVEYLESEIAQLLDSNLELSRKAEREVQRNNSLERALHEVSQQLEVERSRCLQATQEVQTEDRRLDATGLAQQVDASFLRKVVVGLAPQIAEVFNSRDSFLAARAIGRPLPDNGGREDFSGDYYVKAYTGLISQLIELERHLALANKAISQGVKPLLTEEDALQLSCALVTGASRSSSPRFQPITGPPPRLSLLSRR